MAKNMVHLRSSINWILEIPLSWPIFAAPKGPWTEWSQGGSIGLTGHHVRMTLAATVFCRGLLCEKDLQKSNHPHIPQIWDLTCFCHQIDPLDNWLIDIHFLLDRRVYLESHPRPPIICHTGYGTPLLNIGKEDTLKRPKNGCGLLYKIDQNCKIILTVCNEMRGCLIVSV